MLILDSTPPACPTIPDTLSELPLDGTGTGDIGFCSFSGGSSAAAKKKKRQAAAGDSCPAYIGNGGGGQSISFTSPPTSVPPGPSCAVAGGCGGTLCTGYYCSPTPTGLPPGFWDPNDPNTKNPVSATASNTITPTSALPTLPTLPTGPPYSGSGCATYTVSEVCNGSGGQSACEIQTLCVPTAPGWSSYAPDGTPSCPNNGICISTTTIGQCLDTSGGGPIGKRILSSATAPSSATAVETSTLVKRPSRMLSTVAATSTAIAVESSAPAAFRSKPELKERSMVPDFNLKNEESDFANSSSFGAVELFKRQNYGDDGCYYLLLCAAGYCATASKVPCLQASIQAHTGGASGTDVTATVTEDGVIVCQASTHCSIFSDILGDESSCAGIRNYDCGGGNSMTWVWNNIQYTSKKYNNVMYPMYLPRTVTDKIYFCFQTVLGRTLPAACIEDDFAYQDGPCEGFT